MKQLLFPVNSLKTSIKEVKSIVSYAINHKLDLHIVLSTVKSNVNDQLDLMIKTPNEQEIERVKSVFKKYAVSRSQSSSLKFTISHQKTYEQLICEFLSSHAVDSIMVDKKFFQELQESFRSYLYRTNFPTFLLSNSQLEKIERFSKESKYKSIVIAEV